MGDRASAVRLGNAGLLGPPTLVDTHVHFHHGFRRDDFLDAAARNVARSGSRLGLPERPLGLLVLTEIAGRAFFPSFRTAVGTQLSSRWTFLATEESISVLAAEDGHLRLALIAGRQLRTAEGLEVLALGCQQRLPEGRQLGESIESCREAGALVVVPWGFGKWWFGRGRLLARLLPHQDPAEFFLGDSGTRPRLGFKPRLFAAAERLGIRILPGSDPLPLPDQFRRAASYGLVLDTPLDARHPASDLMAALRDPGNRPATFGSRVRLLPFLRTQLAVRLLRPHPLRHP